MNKITIAIDGGLEITIPRSMLSGNESPIVITAATEDLPQFAPMERQPHSIKFDWDSATWEDVYNLCKQAQLGRINLRDYVKIEMTKKMKFREEFLGETEKMMEVIGIDQDGIGTITIQVVDSFQKWVQFSSINTQWDTSFARAKCSELAHFCEASNYIRKVTKRTAVSENSFKNTEHCWFILSASEVDLPQAVQGELLQGQKPYEKYHNQHPKKRIKYSGDYSCETNFSANGWWVRSWSSGSSTGVSAVSRSGAGGYTSYYGNGYVAPACVIG